MKAQNNSKEKCEWVTEIVMENVMESQYDVVTGMYRTTVGVRPIPKQVYKCIPNVVRSDKEPQNLTLEEARQSLEKARQLMEEKKYRDAIENYTVVIDFYPEEAEAYLGRGDAELGLRKYTEAIADYNQAIRIYSIWEVEEKARKARKDNALTQKGVDLHFSRLSAYHNRGVAKKFLGDKTGASDDFRKACSLGVEGDC